MVKFLSTILCRITGKYCPVDYPTSAELTRRMEYTSQRVEEGTKEARRLRHAGEYALLHDRIAAREKRLSRNGA